MYRVGKLAMQKKSRQETLKINTRIGLLSKRITLRIACFYQVIPRRGEWVYGIDNSRVTTNTYHCGQVF